MNIHLVGAGSLQLDRWTDRHEEDNSRFSQFSNGPKNWLLPVWRFEDKMLQRRRDLRQVLSEIFLNNIII